MRINGEKINLMQTIVNFKQINMHAGEYYFKPDRQHRTRLLPLESATAASDAGQFTVDEPQILIETVSGSIDPILDGD